MGPSRCLSAGGLDFSPPSEQGAAEAAEEAPAADQGVKEADHRAKEAPAAEQGAWRIAAGHEPAAERGDRAQRRAGHRLDADLGAMALLISLGAADE